MITNAFMVGIAPACIFVLAAVSAYITDHRSISDNDIAVLETEYQTLNERIRALETETELMPVELNWLTVQTIIARYPDLIWRAGESLEITGDDNIANGWEAVMIASPDLVLPVMRLIQNTVPAEVLEVQLNQRQGVLLINVLGVLK